MRSAQELERTLQRIDGKGYRAYADIRGDWRFDFFSLHVDRVQGDPFASPSMMRLRVPMSEAELPASLWRGPVREFALRDYLARQVARAVEGATRGRMGSGKSGLISIDSGGQEVLERSAVVIHEHFVEARIDVGLPAAGRRVKGREAQRLLCELLPVIAEEGLIFDCLPGDEARRFVECVENQEAIRARLAERGLIAFVADGAILPRESGASDRPMQADRARAFATPGSMAVELELPNPIDRRHGDDRTIRGMGIRSGITLIVGGGYHGKSTLLRALECAVYPHVPGDGREYVVALPDLVKIRAEDGRSVCGADISAFIGSLPTVCPGDPSAAAFERDPHHFSTDDASGSTSQAANIVEAIEAGASGLLLDEDTCATNFMVRDARMQALVASDDEPITPFLDRVEEIRDAFGISTVLVMGGSGDYFDVADAVIMMRDYVASDVTTDARRIAEERPTTRRAESRGALGRIARRAPRARAFDARRGRRDVKISAKGRELILYGEEPIDLRHLAQLVDTSQTRAIAHGIHLASQRFMAEGASLAQILDALEAFLDARGLDALDPFRREPGSEQHPGRYARPRRHEIAAAINRMRSLEVDPAGD